MKKKLYLLIVLVISFGIFGCSKQEPIFPEKYATYDVALYEAGTYGNPLVDCFIEKLTGSDAIFGEISSFYISDIVQKSSSDVEVCVTIESSTEAADYIQSFSILMKYNSRSDTWMVKQYLPYREDEEDEDSKVYTSISIKKTLSDEDILYTLENYINSSFISGQDITFDNISDLLINDISFTQFDSHNVNCRYDISFIAQSGEEEYEIIGSLDYCFCAPTIHESSENDDEYIYSDTGFTIVNYSDEHINFISSSFKQNIN